MQVGKEVLTDCPFRIEAPLYSEGRWRPVARSRLPAESRVERFDVGSNVSETACLLAHYCPIQRSFSM